MQDSRTNYYAILGLDQKCTAEQIRTAYRLLAKQHHPDLNNNSAEAISFTQVLNCAYEILGNPESRKAYDRELAATNHVRRSTLSKAIRNIAEEVQLRLEDFFRGTAREIHIKDPANLGETEIYELVVPPETVPGTRLKVPRDGGGFIIVRLRPLPHFQFKVRGSDLRCDLKISTNRATQGGEEMLRNVLGSMIRVRVPPRIARGEIIRVPGEGMPKRGGRGDLLLRVMYRPEVRIVNPRK